MTRKKTSDRTTAPRILRRPTASSRPAVTEAPRADRGTQDLYVRTLAELTAGVRDALPPMTPAQRQAAVKPGFVAAFVVPALATMAADNGVEHVGEHTLGGMLTRYQRATVLSEIGKAVDGLAEQLKDATLRAQDDAWKGALAFYNVLQRHAETSTALAVRLAPVQSYFRARVRRNSDGTEVFVPEDVKLGAEPDTEAKDETANP